MKAIHLVFLLTTSLITLASSAPATKGMYAIFDDDEAWGNDFSLRPIDNAQQQQPQQQLLQQQAVAGVPHKASKPKGRGPPTGKGPAPSTIGREPHTDDLDKKEFKGKRSSTIR